MFQTRSEGGGKGDWRLARKTTKGTGMFDFKQKKTKNTFRKTEKHLLFVRSLREEKRGHLLEEKEGTGPITCVKNAFLGNPRTERRQKTLHNYTREQLRKPEKTAKNL